MVRTGRPDEEQQYEVIRRIGAGAFAQVFLVLHKTLGRECVLKEITSFTAMSAEKQDAAEEEVRLMNSLHHPNIVGYFDSLVDKDGHLCIFMEYCEHGDVHTYYQNTKRAGQALPSETQVLDWFVQIMLALHVLHAKRILHRDLKTQNIFLSGCRTTSENSEFAVKLGDLGVAKVLSSTKELAMTQIGTPFYMSPELFNNKPYGYKSDIWGLGCVLYELVNGNHAFEAQSINGLALKILKARYTPITSSCSEEMQNLIRSMLSVNPTHRPSLQEMMHVSIVRRRVPAALQAAISATTVSAPDAEVEASAETVLAEQLAALGLGIPGEKTLGVTDAAANPKKDKVQLQQRLERAERRKRREEETLRRLQETSAMLGQYLNAPKGQASPGASSHAFHPVPSVPHLSPTSGATGGYGPIGAPLRAPALSLAPLEGVAFAAQQHSARTEGDDDAPAMSHRDKVLLRKERRREEEQQRFEEEAKKIREENLAYQKAWVMGNKDAVPSRHSKELPMLPGQQAAQPSGKVPFAVTKTMSLASSRQKPHRGDGLQEQPRPPVVHYNEPAPPQETHGTRFSRCPIERPFRRTKSWKGVALEALPAPEEQRHAYHSEDSDFSSSEGSEAGMGGHNARLAAESQVVQQRLEECRAAICRHKMTIEMLQHAVATDAEVLDQDGPLMSTRRSSPAKRPPDPVVVPAAIPAVIQDRVARLRRRCVEGLGGERFEAARQCLQHLASAESQSPVQARDRMLEVLGQEMIGFYALLDQIVHLEQRWGAPPEALDLQARPGGRVAMDESLFGRWPSGMSSVYSTARSRWHSEAEFF